MAEEVKGVQETVQEPVQAEAQETTPAAEPKPEKKPRKTRRAGKEGHPDAMVMPVPVPRLRGDGPDCPICGSGMVVNGTDRSNHPFKIIRYYRCKAVGCGGAVTRIGRRG